MVPLVHSLFHLRRKSEVRRVCLSTGEGVGGEGHIKSGRATNKILPRVDAVYLKVEDCAPYGIKPKLTILQKGQVLIRFSITSPKPQSINRLLSYKSRIFASVQARELCSLKWVFPTFTTDLVDEREELVSSVLITSCNFPNQKR